MLRLPLRLAPSAASRAATTRARLPALPRFGNFEVELASAAPGGAVRMPDMAALETEKEVSVVIPALPDAFTSSSPSSSPFAAVVSPAAESENQVHTVSHPSTHLANGPSRTGDAAQA
ncbi:hypothetical protein JCM10207_007854 [Rhodosporidiobolus poonsookiae]